MAEQRPFITITLDLRDPIEVNDFVGLFASISDQFERYMRSAFPDTGADARIYIKEVRKGSIVADLFPGGIGDMIGLMDGILIVTGFAGLLSKNIRGYIFGERNPAASKSELTDYLDTIRGVANDSNGKAIVETATYEKGLLTKKVALTFTTAEAKQAAANIEEHKGDLDKLENADYSRKLMYFTRPDIGDASVGKRSGERVVIEEISSKDLALIYASALAEQRIKDELRHSSDNIFKKGFVVDVNVQTKGGRAVGYAVTHVHQVIDIPDED